MYPEWTFHRNTGISPGRNENFPTPQHKETMWPGQVSADGTVSVEYDDAAIIQLQCFLLTGSSTGIGQQALPRRIFTCDPTRAQRKTRQ